MSCVGMKPTGGATTRPGVATGRRGPCVLLRVSAFFAAAHFLCAQAYTITDESNVCRMMRLDEATLQIPSGSRTSGPLELLTLNDDRDLSPLLDADGTLGHNATLRMEVMTSSPDCVPHTLTLGTATGGLTIPVSTPSAGWKAGAWVSVSSVIEREDYGDMGSTAWADLTSLQVYYTCANGMIPSQQEEIKVNDGEHSMLQGNEVSPPSRGSVPYILQLQLVRVCKAVPSPSFCVVESTDLYKTACQKCRCKKCHSCSCQVKFSFGSQACTYDACTDDPACFCAPLCTCCYESDCVYECDCDTCCESKHFTSCVKALSYVISSVTPSHGPAEGGTPVVVRSPQALVKTDHIQCRFGNAVSSGSLGESPHEVLCSTPEFPTSQARVVPVSISLDGQQWTSIQDGKAPGFRYCPTGDQACAKDQTAVCPIGYRGAMCELECQGGAANPCNGRGSCRGDGSCQCSKGYEGVACEHSTNAHKQQPDQSTETQGGLSGGPSGVARGVAIGIGVSVSLLFVVGAVLWVKRVEVGEHVFWMLASTRWQRLRQHDHHDDAAAVDAPDTPSTGPSRQVSFFSSSSSRPSTNSRGQGGIMMTSHSSTGSLGGYVGLGGGSPEKLSVQEPAFGAVAEGVGDEDGEEEETLVSFARYRKAGASVQDDDAEARDYTVI